MVIKKVIEIISPCILLRKYLGALFALKRKKMFEGEVTKLQGARMTLENQISALESASINISVFKAMEAASKNLSQIRGDL